MEMGNMIFGNSRGEVEIARGRGWEDRLGELFDAIAGGKGKGDYHGERFENEVFRVFPYWWGDCECGFDEKREQWSEAHPHAESCYQKELARETAAMEKRIGYRPPWLAVDREEVADGAAVISMTPKQTSTRAVSDLRENELRKLYRVLCERHRIPWNDGFGCAVHCSCAHDPDWEAWVADKDHETTCPIVIPNFHYKPTDYRIKWYKYPLRDAYANREISTRDFLNMVDACIASVNSSNREKP